MPPQVWKGRTQAGPSVLVADDESVCRNLLEMLLDEHGFQTLIAKDGDEALRLLRKQQDNLAAVLLDNRMPGPDGVSILKCAREEGWRTPIIMMSGFGTADMAMEVANLGAFDFVAKPFAIQDLIAKLRRATAVWNELSKGPGREPDSLSVMMGSGSAIRRVFAAIDRVAGSDFSVVIRGETGVGKELVAKSLHHRSRRRGGPFIAVDCGTIHPTLLESELFGHKRGAFTGADRDRPGKFEAASGGTLFLDEIQNLTLADQAKFLRAVQEKRVTPVGGAQAVEVDVRIIAATNLDLRALVEAGRFRRDLYYRLCEFEIHVPSLHERLEDIPYLARRFAQEAALALGKPDLQLTLEAERRLCQIGWPGNVRELRNVIRRAALLADRCIEDCHLPVAPVQPRTSEPSPLILPDQTLDSPSMSLKDIVQEAVRRTEIATLRRVLQQTRGNQAEAARILQVDYKTIRTKVKQYAISPKEEGGTSVAADRSNRKDDGNPGEFKPTRGLGLGGIFGNLGTLIDKLGELAEKAEEFKKSGEASDAEGKLRAVYGFSIKSGLGQGGDDVRIEPFGNVRRDEQTGQTVVQDVREPLVDVFEEDDHVLVVAEMPGIDEGHVTLDLRQDTLTLGAGCGDKKYRKEVTLPAAFSADKMSHSCRNGILTVRLQK